MYEQTQNKTSLPSTEVTTCYFMEIANYPKYEMDSINAYEADREDDDYSNYRSTYSPTPRIPIPYKCCGNIICECSDDEKSSINTDEYQQTWEGYEYNKRRNYYSYEEEVNNSDDSFNQWSDHRSEENERMEDLANVPVNSSWTPTREELEVLYLSAMKIKQVIAGQPITRGGSRCDYTCDTENHHVHTYCTICKRNFLYGTTIHSCTMEFELGQIHPVMNSKYLVNHP